MESERDFYQDLYSHLEAREWADVQIVNLLHKIGRSSLLSCEGVLELFEYQQAVDEQVEAEKEYNRWAIGREFGVFTPEEFQRTERYQQADVASFSEHIDKTTSFDSFTFIEGEE